MNGKAAGWMASKEWGEPPVSCWDTDTFPPLDTRHYAFLDRGREGEGVYTYARAA